MIYRFWRKRIVKQDESDGDLEFTTAIGFGGKLLNYWTRNKDNFENGKEYVGITETRYQNLMLDRWVLKTEERFAWHMSFLPQEVVRCEVWIGGFLRRHNYRQQFIRKNM
jgi:hypothetical protein